MLWAFFLWVVGLVDVLWHMWPWAERPNRMADWRLNHEARHGRQVLAVALGSRDVFVLFRDQVYVLSAEEAGPLLPGRMLSRDECRALFGPKHDTRKTQRLTPRKWAEIEVLPAGEGGPASLRLKQSDGSVRTWTFASTSKAEDLCARLRGPLDREGRAIKV